ncbi:MAG: serine O-acetyltransferase [Magnetospirillum sp. WYHS-4]
MVFKTLREDIDAFMSRDPAARSRLEVLLCYPGLHALLFYRLTSRLWRAGWWLTARWLSHVAKMVTGVEIHPGATIGRRLVIDHGTGVVIGETAEIGDDVTLYQGITLGGTAPSVDSKSQANKKRHPTLENGVIVGSGAQVLGPITIGHDARVGANAVVTHDMPPEVTAVGIPARIVMPRDRKKAHEFVAYGTAEDIQDPILRDLHSLRSQISALKERIGELEGQRPAPQLKEGQEVDSAGAIAEVAAPKTRGRRGATGARGGRR